MKKFLHISLLTALVIASSGLSAQTVYSINSDMSISGAKIPTQCENCIINIAKDATLTINQEIFLKNSTFNGGTIVANKKITFWSDGAFNGVKLTVNNNSALGTSGGTNMNITNSEFTFLGNSTATFWAATNLTGTKMNFLDNAGLISTTTFNLRNSSALIAGDGTTTSKAYLKFDGGLLNEYDNSYVSVQNYNNYYYNWNPYYSGNNNRYYVTKNNNMNCGTAGKNACASQYLYGPATLNFAGVASSAVLPVKLSAFAVKLSGSAAIITWTTDMELNSSRFEIERSFDGINWTKIAIIDSKTNSSIRTEYTYTDILKLTATVNYRLKMIDQDETFAYSPIRSVKANATVSLNMFPNPATNYVVITSTDNSNKNVQLINRNGQLVKQVTGMNNIHLALSEFTAGNYFVKVTDAAGNVQTFKLILNK